MIQRTTNQTCSLKDLKMDAPCGRWVVIELAMTGKQLRQPVKNTSFYLNNHLSWVVVDGSHDSCSYFPDFIVCGVIFGRATKLNQNRTTREPTCGSKKTTEPGLLLFCYFVQACFILFSTSCQPSAAALQFVRQPCIIHTWSWMEYAFLQPTGCTKDHPRFVFFSSKVSFS